MKANGILHVRVDQRLQNIDGPFVGRRQARERFLLGIACRQFAYEPTFLRFGAEPV
jgi:hypothetical protein